MPCRASLSHQHRVGHLAGHSQVFYQHRRILFIFSLKIRFRLALDALVFGEPLRLIDIVLELIELFLGHVIGTHMISHGQGAGIGDRRTGPATYLRKCFTAEDQYDKCDKGRVGKPKHCNPLY